MQNIIRAGSVEHTAPHGTSHARMIAVRTFLGARGPRARALGRGGLGPALLRARARRHLRGVVVISVLRRELQKARACVLEALGVVEVDGGLRHGLVAVHGAL